MPEHRFHRVTFGLQPCAASTPYLSSAATDISTLCRGSAGSSGDKSFRLEHILSQCGTGAAA